MSERFHHYPSLAETPLELVDDFWRVSAELNDGIVELAGAETLQLRNELSPEEPPRSLQDTYHTPYQPERTIPAIGKIGLLLAQPELVGERLERDALAKLEADRDPEYLRRAA